MKSINEIKKDFSMFTNHPDLVYLDSAATSLTPDCVVDSMSDYYKSNRSSVHRGLYKLAMQASNDYEDARSKMATYLNCKNEEVIFTKSTTASINNVARSIEHLIAQDDEIITTELEHHSNYLPWLELCERTGAKLIVIKSQDLTIQTSDVLAKVTDKTKLIAIHHVSNVIGNTVDVNQICEFANERKIMTLIDGAQAAAHMAVDLKAINPSFYTISVHKLLGPTGLGVLYINSNVADLLKPFDYGGDMVTPSSVDLDTYNVKNPSLKFEGGTPSIAEVIGLGAAIDYLTNIGIDNIHDHEVMLKRYAVAEFAKISDMATLYNSNNDSGLLTFNIHNVKVHDAVSESMLSDVTFDNAGIALRDGQMCNNLTMKYVLGTPAVLRASLYLYNDKTDVDKLIVTIKNIYQVWN
ncbi:cysteine desulfurase [Mollicutes bacterium LVI A0039]|nr:cysteine desulfurase [Mollicutes bacterium LVI A0039]